jgi:hypothetical protein
MFFVCVVLSDRGLCGELITRLEEYYLAACDYETLCDEEVIARAGLQSQHKK